jgi:hypothetical protein
MRRRLLGLAIVVTVAGAGCGGDGTKPAAAPASTAPPSSTSTTAVAVTSTSTSTSTSIADGPAVEVSETAPVVYTLHTADGVSVRYTILAPADDPVVKRIQDFHNGVRETRPLRMILAEVDNQSSEAFEVGDLTVTQGDGDKVHFIEAWLYVGQWHRNVQGEKDSPFYMEGFDLSNDLVDRGIVEPGTKSLTVMAAEDFLTSVRSAVARDRSGELVPMQRES